MRNSQTDFDKYYAEAVNLLQQSGSTAEVYEFVRAIEDEDYRERTLDRVAQFLAAQGNLREALRYCRAITRPLQRADALFEIGRVLKSNRNSVEAGNIFDQVVATAEEIECPYDRGAVLLHVAHQLESLRMSDQALRLVHRAVELAKPLPQDFEASKTLRGCARALAAWNRLSDAVGVAEAIDHRWSGLRETTLEEIHGRGQWPVRLGVNPEEHD